MYVALNGDGERVCAVDARRGDGFLCQHCGEALSLRRGTARAAHFAHMPDSQCVFRHDGKTKWHLDWQLPFGSEHMERIYKIGKFTHIADVMVGNVVIEFQHSRISEKDIESRLLFWAKYSMNLVWVVDFREQFSSGCIEPIGHGRNRSTMFQTYDIAKWQRDIIGQTEIYENRVFLQIDEDRLIEVVWLPDYPSNKFAGYVRSRKAFIEFFLNMAAIDYSPKLIVDEWLAEESIEFLMAGYY